MRILILLLLLTSCGVKTSSNINFDPEDIKIIRKDNLCFAVVATKSGWVLTEETTGLGMAHVPCDKL